MRYRALQVGLAPASQTPASQTPASLAPANLVLASLALASLVLACMALASLALASPVLASPVPGGGGRTAGVTLRVDLGPYLAAGYFDPATDRLEVRGDFSDWRAGPPPLVPSGAGIYQVTLDLPPGPIAYKFVIVRQGGAVVWEDHVPNRRCRVPAEGSTLAPVLFDDLAAAPDPAACLAGADLSFVPRLRALGAVYGPAGRREPLLPLLRRAGFELVRLRLWHTPAEPWQGLDATVAFAREVTAAGFALMLDLHYSDTWADPEHQTPPAAWTELLPTVLADSVAAYTTAVLTRFAAAGAMPAYVQIGNEIDGGLLWDAARVGWRGSVWDTPRQWSVLTTVLQAAAAAVRAAAPLAAGPRVVVHLAAGGDNAGCRRFCDHLAAAGVDYDVIGLSFYTWWHGTLWNLETNVRDLRARYGKEVMVVETGYPWTLAGRDDTGNFVTSTDPLPAGYPPTPAGQCDFLRDLRRVIATAGGSGVIYWEPAFVPVTGGPPNPYENLTLFDFEGIPLPALTCGAPPASARPRR